MAAVAFGTTQNSFEAGSNAYSSKRQHTYER